MKYILRFCVLVVVLLQLLPGVVQAAEYSVRPFLFDEVLDPRDVSIQTVLLTNEHKNRKYVVYATVNEISIDTDGEIKEFVTPVMTDRTTTVTSWIEVTRGRIEINPESQLEVPVTLRIDPFAEPGEYHAFVGFVPAPNRPAAEKIAMDGQADGVVVKITIPDQRKDSLRIGSFLIERFVTGEDSRTVRIEVENVGEKIAAPTGEVIFYDSRGVEVGAQSVNEEGVTVAPGDTITLTTEVPIEKTIGRFKANVALAYGATQKASMHDSTSFYFIPLHYLLIILGAILVISLVLTLMFKRAFIDSAVHDDADDVTMYVKDGCDATPQDHDINLKQTE